MSFFKFTGKNKSNKVEEQVQTTLNIQYKEDQRNKKTFSTWLMVSWNEVLTGFTISEDFILGGAMKLDRNGKVKGLFNDTLKFKHLSKIKDLEILNEIKQPAPFPEHKNIIVTEDKRQMIWLDTPSPRTTFGGYNSNKAINMYQGPVFKDGYCYLNLLYAVTARLFASNHDEYGDFVQACPVEIGSYPTLATVSQLATFMISHFPELSDAEIPCVYVSPHRELIHIGDRRNRPSEWGVLKLNVLSDLSSILRDPSFEEMLTTPVGSCFSTSNIEIITHEEQYLNPTILAAWNKILVERTTGGYNAYANMLTTSDATVVGKFSNIKILNTSLADLVLDDTINEINALSPLENPNSTICVDESIPKIWLDMPTLSSTFGGPTLQEPLYSFIGTQFVDGFCYLNIFVDLGFHIRKCHTMHFANFIETLPNVLGAYPALGQISQAMQYLVARCPELLPCSIPAIYYSNLHNMLHVGDKRGRPAGWQILKVHTVCQLIASQGDSNMHMILPLPTGASEDANELQDKTHYLGSRGVYTNWKPMFSGRGPWWNVRDIMEAFYQFRNTSRTSPLAYNALQRDIKNLQEVSCVGIRKRFDADTATNTGFVCVIDIGDRFLRTRVKELPVICTRVMKAKNADLNKCYDMMTNYFDEIEKYIFNVENPRFYNRDKYEGEMGLTWNNQWWEVDQARKRMESYTHVVLTTYKECKEKLKNFSNYFVYDSTRFLYLLTPDEEISIGKDWDDLLVDIPLQDNDTSDNVEAGTQPLLSATIGLPPLTSYTPESLALSHHHEMRTETSDPAIPSTIPQMPDLPSNEPGPYSYPVVRHQETPEVTPARPSKTMHTFVVLMTVFSVLTTVFKFIPRHKAIAIMQALKRFINRFRRPRFNFFRRPPPDDDFPSNFTDSGSGPNPPPPPHDGGGPRQSSGDSFNLPTPTSEDDLIGIYSYSTRQPPPTVIQINDAVLNALFTENFTDLLANAYSWQRSILRYVTASDLTDETPIAAIYRLLNAVSAIQEEMNESGMMAEGALSIVARAEARLNPEHPGISLAEHLHELQQEQLQFTLRDSYILSLSAAGETLVNIIKNEIEPVLNRPNAEYGTPIHRRTYVLMRRYIQILLEADVGEEHILEHIAEGRNHVEQLNVIYEIDQPSLVLRNLQQIAELRSASAEDALRLGVELQAREADARHREEVQRLAALNDTTRVRQAQLVEEENERARQKHELEIQIAKKTLEMEEEHQRAQVLRESNEREREQHQLNLQKVSLEMDSMRSTEARERISRPIETAATALQAAGFVAVGAGALRRPSSTSPVETSRSRSQTRVASSSPLGLRNSLMNTTSSTTARNFGSRIGTPTGTRRFLTGRGYRLR